MNHVIHNRRWVANLDGTFDLDIAYGQDGSGAYAISLHVEPRGDQWAVSHILRQAPGYRVDDIDMVPLAGQWVQTKTHRITNTYLEALQFGSDVSRDFEQRAAA